MAKIVAVHAGEQHNQFNLLKQIDEADSLAKRVAAAAGAAVSGGAKAAKDAWSNKSKEKSKDEQPARTATQITDYDSALATIAGELLTPPPDEARIVVFVPEQWLKSMYLVAGGSGGKLIDSFEDEEVLSAVKSIAKGEGDARIKKLKPDFSYEETFMAKPPIKGADRAIQINVPKSMLSSMADAMQDANKARELLKKMMSHRLYVMTLNIPKAAKLIGTGMSDASSAEEAANFFDPSVIENFPNRQALLAAKKSWEAAQSAKPTPDSEREAEVSKKEKEGKWAERERAAEIAQTGAKGDIGTEIINLIARAENPSKAATSVFSLASKRGMSKPELLTKLDALQPLFQNVKVRETRDKIENFR